MTSAFTCFCAASSVARVRPERTIFAPAFSSSMAPASPMPEPPPVIHATLPLSSPARVLLGTEEHLRLFFAEARRLPAPVGEHFHRLPDGRPLGDAIAPALDVGIIVDVHALPFRRAQPGHRRHVGDRVLAAGEPLAFRELPVEHAIEAVRLVLVWVHLAFGLRRRTTQGSIALADRRAG